MTKKYFYEKSKFKEFVSNITYHQLLQMDDIKFTEWAKTLRNEVTCLSSLSASLIFSSCTWPSKSIINI